MEGLPPDDPFACGWHDMGALIEIWIDFHPCFESAQGMWMSTNSFQFELYYEQEQERLGLYVMGKGGTDGFFEAFIPDGLIEGLGIPIDRFELFRDGVVASAAAVQEGATFSLEEQAGGWLFSYVGYVHPDMPSPPCWQQPCFMFLPGKQVEVGERAQIPLVIYDLPDPMWAGSVALELFTPTGTPLVDVYFTFNPDLENTRAWLEDDVLHYYFEDTNGDATDFVDILDPGGGPSRRAYELRIGTLNVEGINVGAGELVPWGEIMVTPDGGGDNIYPVRVDAIPGPLMVGSSDQAGFPFISVEDHVFDNVGDVIGVGVTLCGDVLPNEGLVQVTAAWPFPPGIRFDPGGDLLALGELPKPAPAHWIAGCAYETVTIVDWDCVSGWCPDDCDPDCTPENIRIHSFELDFCDPWPSADPHVRPLVVVPTQATAASGWVEIDVPPLDFMAIPGRGIATIGGSTYGPLSALARYRAMRPMSLTEDWRTHYEDPMTRSLAIRPQQGDTQYQPLGGFSDWLVKRAAQGSVFRMGADTPWVRPMSEGDNGINFEMGVLEIGAIGDINHDGYISLLDVRLCLQITTGVITGTAAQRTVADVDEDGDVDLADAQLLARYVGGIVGKLGGD